MKIVEFLPNNLLFRARRSCSTVFCELAREALQEAPGANRRVIHAVFLLKYDVFSSVFVDFLRISEDFVIFCGTRFSAQKRRLGGAKKTIFVEGKRDLHFVRLAAAIEFACFFDDFRRILEVND